MLQGVKGVSRLALLPRKTHAIETLLEVCPLSVFCKLGPAFLHSVKCVAGKERSDEIKIGIGDEPKRSVKQARSFPHLIVHISLVVESGLSMQ